MDIETDKMKNRLINVYILYIQNTFCDTQIIFQLRQLVDEHGLVLLHLEPQERTHALHHQLVHLVAGPLLQQEDKILSTLSKR